MKIILPRLHVKLERWKYNKNLDIYVSDCGNFRESDGKTPITPKLNQKGYMVLLINDKHYFAHRIVLSTWAPIPNPTEMTVDHLNHNKRDNSVRNLEWVTPEVNVLRAQQDSAKDSTVEGIYNFVIKLASITDVAYWLIKTEHMASDVHLERVENKVRLALFRGQYYCDYKYILNNDGSITVIDRYNRNK